MKKYDAIIFDCYGTLYQLGNMAVAWQNWFRAFHEIMLSEGLKIEGDELKRNLDGFFSIPEPRTKEHGFSVFEQRVANKLSSMKISWNKEIINRIAENTISAWHTEVNIDPQAKKVLQKLSEKYKIALVSNFDHPIQIRKMFEADEIMELFDNITISGEVGVSKPDAAIFMQSLRQLNITNNAALYIGDSEEDLIGAENAGLDFVLISHIKEGINSLGADYRENSADLQEDWTVKYPQIKTKVFSLIDLLKIIDA